MGEELEYKYVIMKGYAEQARALSIPKVECAVRDGGASCYGKIYWCSLSLLAG